MTVQSIVTPLPSFTGLDGLPLSGGYIYIGEANQDPREYPASAFYDQAMLVPAPQPLRTTAGYVFRNGGPASIWLGDGAHSMLVLDAKGRQIAYLPVMLGTLPASIAASNTVDRFSGDGATVSFTLSATPASENDVQVFVSGVYVQKNAFSVVGNTLTFAAAPAAGTNNVEAVVGIQLDYASISADMAAQVAAAAGSASAAATSATASAASHTAIDDRIYPGTYNPAAAPTTKPISGSPSADGDEFLGTDGYTYAHIGGVWVNQTAAAAASAAAALVSQGASAMSATNAASAQALSEAARDAANISAATVGDYANAAASNVPRGLTQASVGAITAGSGGTNGTFALAWSGGNFSPNPVGTFTVAGGVLTAVTITIPPGAPGSGLYIGASPTVPTPSFAASSGLTGAAVVLTAQFLIASGQGYWVEAADGLTKSRYYNNSGVATADPSVGAIPNAALVTDIGNGPLRREDYGPVKRFPSASIVTGTGVTLDSTANRFTIGATTGSLVMSTPTYIPVALGDTVSVLFEATIGSPSLAQIRFYNGGTALDSALTMVPVGRFYRLEATATNAATTAVRITINNTSGSSIEVTRPQLAFKKASAKDGIPDPNVTALRNLAAASSANDAPNIFRIDSTGRASGTGAVPTLNADGTVVCHGDAISYIRGDIVMTEGTALVWMVQLDPSNLNIRAVRINYTGTMVVLDSLGGGLWGKVGTIPAGVGTTVYMRVEVDNSANTQYTTADVTVRTIRLIAGTQYPTALPPKNPAWDPSMLFVRQTANTEIMVYKSSVTAGSDRYIGWPINMYTGQVGGGAGLNLGRFEEAQRQADTFTKLGWRADTGEHLMAVREINTIFAGGTAHGNQIAGEIPSLGSCTISLANPALVTKTAHGLAAGTAFAFDTTGLLPAPLFPGITYYVLASGLAANTFQFAATPGGTAISTLGGTQYGDHLLRRGVVTITIATPGVITLVAHGFAANDRVALTTTGALPTGLPIGTPLYVLASGLAADSFQVSLTTGGTAIATSGTQSGVHTIRKRTESFFIDGVKKPIADTTANFIARQVRTIARSVILSTTVLGQPMWNVTQEITFEAGYVYTRNRIIFIGPTATQYSEIYLAMLSLYKQFNSSGSRQIDSIYMSPDFVETDTPLTGGSNSNLSISERHVYTGSDGFSAEIEVISGWTRAERRSWMQNAGTGTGNLKSYTSLTGVNSTGGSGAASGYPVNPGDVFEQYTRYRLATVN